MNTHNTDFTGMTDLELVQLQAEMRKSPFPEDKAFLDAILEELGERQRDHDKTAVGIIGVIPTKRMRIMEDPLTKTDLTEEAAIARLISEFSTGLLPSGFLTPVPPCPHADCPKRRRCEWAGWWECLAGLPILGYPGDDEL